MTLPKQLFHWAMLAGLKPETKTCRRMRLPYFIGHGRHWRINDRNQLCVSCPLSEFDRWANSTLAEIHLVPLTQSGFANAVLILLNAAKFESVIPDPPNMFTSSIRTK